MYLPTVAFQTKIFFLSIGLGFLLGILYDIFYIFRISFTKGKISIYIIDVFYLLSCSFITFLYILSVSSGMVRIYILIGEILGWIIYYVSSGYFVVKYVTAGVNSIKRFNKKISRLIVIPFKKINGFSNKLFKNSYNKVKKNKKNYKRLKLGLKLRKNILYNTVNMVDDVTSNEGNEKID